MTPQKACTKSGLTQLWRRLVFNIVISNSDDHLRNQGFLMVENGWQIFSVYDFYTQGLHLNITDSDNRLDFNLAFDVVSFFQLIRNQANEVYQEVIESVKIGKS